VGAVLLSRTGFFGGPGIEKVELDDLSEISKEIKKPEFKKSSEQKKSPPLSKKNQRGHQPVRSLKKENPPVEKKAFLKKQTIKMQSPSTDKPKEKQILEKEALESESPLHSMKKKEELPATQTQEASGKPNKKQAGEKRELEPEPLSGSVKQKEAPEKQNQRKEEPKSGEEMKSQPVPPGEEPFEKGQEDTPGKQQKEASEKQQGDVPPADEQNPAVSKPDSAHDGGPRPPADEQNPAVSKPYGFYRQNIPTLDIGAARVHTQLKQVEGNPIPAYPEEALKNRWEGRVEVYYYVNPAGFIEKIHLKNSSGHSVLDNSALRTLARYRYYPGQEGWVRHFVEFFLERDKEIKKTAPLRLHGSPRESASQN